MEDKTKEKISNILPEIYKTDINKINKLLFELRRIDFEERFKPNKIDFKEYLDMIGRPIPETKEHLKLREEKIEKVRKENDIKEKAILEIKKLETEKQKMFVKELFGIIKSAFERNESLGGYFEDRFFDEISKRLGEDVFNTVNLKEDIKGNINEYTSESLRYLAEEKIYDTIKEEPFFKIGANLEASISLLEDLIERNKLFSEIEGMLHNFFGDEDVTGIWDSLDKNAFNSFLQKINVKKITDRESEIQIIEEMLKLAREGFTVRLRNERGKVEVLLRELINNVLNKKLGDDWVNKIKDTNVKGYLNRIVEDRIKKDKVGVSDNLKDYLDLGNCIKIIDSEWEFFENIFLAQKGDTLGFISRNDFFGSLDLIIGYGNPIEHRRFINWKDFDEERFKIAVEKIKKCVEKYRRMPE